MLSPSDKKFLIRLVGTAAYVIIRGPEVSGPADQLQGSGEVFDGGSIQRGGQGKVRGPTIGRIGKKGYRSESPWGQKFKPSPEAPLSKWELFILKLGFDGDREVLKELREGRIRCGIIAQWVRSHADQVFVPTKVLEEIGWTQSRWDS